MARTARTGRKKDVTYSRRKNRKLFLQAKPHVRRILMSARLSPELRAKHGIKSVPIRRDDEVTIMSGGSRGKEGKVVKVKRRSYAIYVEKVTKDKANGSTIHLPIHPSNVMITALKLDKDRRKFLERKEHKDKAAKGKDKVQEESVQNNMSTVD
eukprot:TRINITY_DN468_c0_g1_i5.p1 TRINITY_DN468_c0_g1~~TRINITY_DN468_c0_g1_i5.p1  ORF type:complete len:181 (+),score=40.18 TRINITY_DN468_c0_g1_i5:83-544(+)